LYLKYKQIKFSLLNKTTTTNLKLKKFTFLNILKKKLFNNFNTKVLFCNTNNSAKIILSFFKLFKEFNLINLNNYNLKNKRENKFNIFFNTLFNSQILNNKTHDIRYLKNYENNIYNYNKSNIINFEKKLNKYEYSTSLKEILNIKIQLFSILFFSKVLTYNLKLLLNNNYLKLLLKLINKSSKQNVNNFFIKSNELKTTNCFKTLYLFFIYKTILINNKKNLENFINFVDKNKKIEFVLKDLFKNYF
jgi:hypothetical protein